MTDKQRKLLKKLQALTERGVGGEKETAERKLKQLMTKYGVDKLEFDEELIDIHDFRYHDTWEKKLIVQIVYKIMNNTGNVYRQQYGRGSKSILMVECTQAQAVQIGIEFEFYRDLWKEELDLFFVAFIHKHCIFGKKDEERNLLTPEEMERWGRMRAMMEGMQDKSIIPLIETK